jgi:hypothetical protein
MAKMDTPGVRGLLGVLLADACLMRQRAPGQDRIFAAMHGGSKERDFLQEKAEEVRRFVPTKARVIPYRTPVRESGNSTEVLRFRFTSDALLPIYNLLYPSREREITGPALELLGGRAAAWLWAEGACLLGGDGAMLRRVGRWEGEAQLVRGWLQMLTGAESTVVHPRAGSGSGKGLPRLWFQPDQASRLRESLAPYAPASRWNLFVEG